MSYILRDREVVRDVHQTMRIRINGQSTSVRLKTIFGEFLDRLAIARDVSTTRLFYDVHSEILMKQGEPKNFVSVLRCMCLERSRLVTKESENFTENISNRSIVVLALNLYEK